MSTRTCLNEPLLKRNSMFLPREKKVTIVLCTLGTLLCDVGARGESLQACQNYFQCPETKWTILGLLLVGG